MGKLKIDYKESWLNAQKRIEVLEKEAEQLREYNSYMFDTIALKSQQIEKLEQENAELKCECRRCVYSDSPCVLSDYGKDRNGICDHFKDVFDEVAELKKEVEKHKWSNIFLEDCAGYDKKIAEEYTTLQERIEQLEKELEAEKKVNEQIKVRFVRCNTCTEEMKSKCLMFSENLCEGERCEELVDLMSLINKEEEK